MVLNEMGNTDVSTVQFRKAAIQRRSSKTIFDEGEADASEVEVVVEDDAPEEDTREYLDWFTGVFVPCLLNIWGVIMFLRTGWVVGQAGIWQGSAIVIASNIVTTITALSMCAIATNGEVGGGGAYFLISRALGPQFGGPIGILFFVAQAVATSMYVVGFSDALLDIVKKGGGTPFTGSWAWDQRVIGLVTSTVLLAIAFIGVSWYAKCQIFLLAALTIAIIATFVGSAFPGIPDPTANALGGFIGYGGVLPDFSVNQTRVTPLPSSLLSSNWQPQYSRDPATGVKYDFFTTFSVFFPAVTGIMAGANMSGDLGNPSVAIPKGTLRAIVLTFISYVALIWVLGLTCVRCVGEYCPIDPAALWDPAQVAAGNVPSGGLLYDKLIMERMSLWSPLVYVGVFAATLSSALASIVGAPRILQSVAADEVFPWSVLTFFGEGEGPENEPRRAYILTYIVAQACVMIGNLDVIAPLISNFFMISYALVNYACFSASNSNSPGWRPSFRFYSKWLSLFGAALCLFVMFAFDIVASCISVSVCGILYYYLEAIDPDVNWGPAGQARIQWKAISQLEKMEMYVQSHVKTFRPLFLVMSKGTKRGLGLINFTCLLGADQGASFFLRVIERELSAKDITASSDTKIVRRSSIKFVDDGKAAEISSEHNATNRDKKMSSAEVGLAAALAIREANDARAEDSHFFYNKASVNFMRGSFCDAVVADDLAAGILMGLQLSGMGKLRANTVVAGFPTDWENRDKENLYAYETMLYTAMEADRGIVVLRDDDGVFKNMKVAGLQVNSSVLSAKTIQQLDETADGLDCGDTVRQLLTSCVGNDDAEVSQQISKTPANKVACIDVWWLIHDGGLTMLLPYLIRKSRSSPFAKHKLRVMVISEELQGMDSRTVRLATANQTMLHLLNKLRIKAEIKVVDAKLETPPSKEYAEKYASLGFPIDDDDASRYKAAEEDDNAIGLRTKNEANTTKNKATRTNHIVRLSEIIHQHSVDSGLVFVTLPKRYSSIRTARYLSWLEMLSGPCPATGKPMPPTVMIRGCEEQPALTFEA